MFFDSFRNSSGSSNPDPRVRFWTLRYLWPEETLTHISLAEAVHALGKKLYGDQWTGSEPGTELISALPEYLSASISRSDLMRGCQILYEHDADYRKQIPIPFELPMPSNGEWAVAVEISKKMADESLQAYSRYFRVCETLRGLFKFDRVKTALRANQGGSEFPLNREHWNLEHGMCRFDCCQMDAENLFATRPVTENGWWIYVEKASFLLHLSGQTNIAAEEIANALMLDRRISPYLRCMVSAAMQLDLCPENQIEKEALKLMVREYWTGSEPLTDKDCDRMATLLRLPESKLGRGSPRRKAEKNGDAL